MTEALVFINVLASDVVIVRLLRPGDMLYIAFLLAGLSDRDWIVDVAIRCRKSILHRAGSYYTVYPIKADKVYVEPVAELLDLIISPI